VIPDQGNPQSWDRHVYVRNAPVNFTDPTGHRVDDGCNFEGCSLPSTGQSGGSSNNNNSTKYNGFDSTLGGNNNNQTNQQNSTTGTQSQQSSSNSNENNGNEGVNWIAAVSGIGLTLVGGVIFIGGLTIAGSSLVELNVEGAAAGSIVAVGGGLVSYIGIRLVISSGIIPGTKRN
jgi:hypothetical protein